MKVLTSKTITADIIAGCERYFEKYQGRFFGFGHGDRLWIACFTGRPSKKSLK
jgi:hypothetical protein